ncbi:MAG: tail fiber domain-containing protein [Bacteroidia bacterium]
MKNQINNTTTINCILYNVSCKIRLCADYTPNQVLQGTIYKTLVQGSAVILLVLLSIKTTTAQNVGINTSFPDASAILDITHTNRGLLVPRIQLTDVTVAAPVTAPANSLLVFNLLPAGVPPNNVETGYYYWDGLLSKWVSIATGGESWSLFGNNNATATSKLGTLNARDLHIVANNNEKITITSATGYVGINQPVPTQHLDLAGNLQFSGALMPSNTAGTAGQILTSAGAGTAPTWANLPTTTNVLNNPSNNIITSTVNGIADTTLIITNVSNTLAGTNFTTTVNGIATTPVDLSTLVPPTTNTLSSAANIITSTVDSITDTTLIITTLANNYNTTTGALNTTVNGVTGADVTLPTNQAIADSVTTKAWLLTGNAGTTAGTNFVGTTDGQDLVFKTNAIENMRILNSNGNVGIGTPTPVYKLDIQTTDVSLTASYGRVLKLKASHPAMEFEGISGNKSGFIAYDSQTGGFNSEGMKFFVGETPGSFANSPILTLKANQNVGIGTPTPNNKLEITHGTAGNSGLRFTNLPNAGVLSTDANGDVVNTTAPNPANALFWGITGNSGTTAGTNFVGTTDNQDLVFKRNNVQSGLINNTIAATSFGALALNPLNTGLSNSAFGFSALNKNTTGYFNTSIGSSSLASNTIGFHNTGIGANALGFNVSGNSNTATGANTLLNNVSGANNTGMGVYALHLNTVGNNNTAIGNNSLYNNTASNNTAIGSTALTANTTGYSNVAIGVNALRTNTTQSNLVAVGDSALLNNTTGVNNTAIGSKALTANTTGVNNTALGHQALLLNTNTNNNTAIGANSLLINTGGGNTAVGAFTLKDNTANNTTAIGLRSLENNTTGIANTALGAFSLQTNTTGDNNTAIGNRALSLNTADHNTAIGLFSLRLNTIGTFNTATGSLSLDTNSTGTYNTANGYQTLYTNTTGNNNTAIGGRSLHANSTGIQNTAIGYNSGIINTTGSNNTFLGTEADATTNNFTNATAIGYNAKVGASNALILGGTGADAVNVGIGTTAPIHKLTVEGSDATVYNPNLVNMNTYDNSIMARFWNSGTSTSASFIRLMNNSSNVAAVDLGVTGNNGTSTFVIKGRDGLGQMYETFRIVGNTGNVGIGTTSPATALHIGGDADVTLNGVSPYFATKVIAYPTTNTDISGLAMSSDGNAVGANSWPPTTKISFHSTENHSATNKGTAILFSNTANASTTLTERMRIMDNGNVGIGTTTPTEKLHVAGFAYIAGKTTSERAGAGNPMFEARKTDAGAGSMMAFLTNGAITGEITTSGVATAYNTTSDIRLKENIKASTKGLTDVLKIEVKEYNYKADETKKTETGFIAQQLVDIYPQAVTKGGEDIKTQPWMVDYSKLTPLLIKGMQEQQAQIEALKKEIEMLKKK